MLNFSSFPVPIEIAGSSDGSEGNETSTIGILGYEDYDDQQPVLPDSSNIPHSYNHDHDNNSSQNGNIPFDRKKAEKLGSHDMVDGQDEFLRKTQITPKNNISSSFPNNIEGSFISGVRSSFGSSTRSNSSSIGTNGTNNSVSSRESTTETQNIHTAYVPRSSPNTSLLGDSLARNSESENPMTVERGVTVTTENAKPGGYGDEYFLLNGWNAEGNKRDATRQSGSLSSFSSSNGSSGNRPSSNRSHSSAEKKIKKKTAQNIGDGNILSSKE